MEKRDAHILRETVALRKESVDRNNLTQYDATNTPVVALRKESVDRNWLDHVEDQSGEGRSPQGERG